MIQIIPEAAERPGETRFQSQRRRILIVGTTSAFLLFALGLIASRCCRDTSESDPQAATRRPPTVLVPLRAKPAHFRPNTYMPNRREGEASGSIDLGSFSAGRDLVYVEDHRVWWESDNDNGDVECDHTMHRAMEAPLRRLIFLVTQAGGKLEVHDAYRPTGIHSTRSLHMEGRALDLTCDELGLEELARLCWMAGFDWVYHEAKAKGGAHVHVSVKRHRRDTPKQD